ncbi:hypothetical protein PHYBOEH_011547 [Phytophthora boehmeriae]|uniref:Transmembrane protein n=1 Tax=Phytophthora boehmeriae TaxID=109152 RepID=A0A8T1VL93_9STRA|nr:hypothetical protein PHYBOEH_011547 [Phytophthora boehmeriae]
MMQLQDAISLFEAYTASTAAFGIAVVTAVAVFIVVPSTLFVTVDCFEAIDVNTAITIGAAVAIAVLFSAVAVVLVAVMSKTAVQDCSQFFKACDQFFTTSIGSAVVDAAAAFIAVMTLLVLPINELAILECFVAIDFDTAITIVLVVAIAVLFGAVAVVVAAVMSKAAVQDQPCSQFVQTCNQVFATRIGAAFLDGATAFIVVMTLLVLPFNVLAVVECLEAVDFATAIAIVAAVAIAALFGAFAVGVVADMSKSVELDCSQFSHTCSRFFLQDCSHFFQDNKYFFDTCINTSVGRGAAALAIVAIFFVVPSNELCIVDCFEMVAASVVSTATVVLVSARGFVVIVLAVAGVVLLVASQTRNSLWTAHSHTTTDEYEASVTAANEKPPVSTMVCNERATAIRVICNAASGANNCK